MASTDNNIGILDPQGNNPNPLTNTPYSDNYKKLAKDWSKLPAYKQVTSLIKIFKENQVILTAFGTGTGKTVIVPKVLLHVYNYDAKIAITLPKQMIAKSAATYAAATLDVPLGVEVGYKYKGSPSNSNSDMTKLLYASDGTIVQKLLKYPDLRMYDAVIIDELHEHKIQIDMLLYLLRETLKQRPEFKIVLMSATVDVDIFRDYFKDFKFKSVELESERLFPIESVFVPKTLDYDNTIKECFKTLIHILETDDPTKPNAHDIIIFVTSSNDGFKLCKQLHNHLENEKKDKCKVTCKGDVYCVEVYSGMDPAKEELAQNKILYKTKGNYNRKVVIGTNVMESSLTIDGVKYVIDTGYEFSSSFDPVNSARKLDRQLISQAQAKQRMGRAGRTEPGKCYHLYSEQDFNHKMLKFPEPDIQSSDITIECLQLLSNNLTSTTDRLMSVLTNFISSPKENFIRYALDVLLKIDAIKNDKLTPLGTILINIPDNNIFMSVAILFGKIYDCSRELLKIAALIDVSKANVNELFNTPNYRDNSKEGIAKVKRFEKVRKDLANKNGDHLTLLYIYEQYVQIKKDPKQLDAWCRSNFLKKNLLEKAAKQYKTNKHQLQVLIPDPTKLDLDIKLFSEVNDMQLEDRVLFSLLAGLRLHTAVNKKGTEFYRASASNLDKIKLHKFSFLSLNKTKPHNVMYHELFISMGRSELSIVSAIPDNIIKIVT